MTARGVCLLGSEPVLSLKYKNPGQSAAFFHPARFLPSFHFPAFTSQVSPLYWLCVLVAGGYREAEIHLQPGEEPRLEQGHA